MKNDSEKVLEYSILGDFGWRDRTAQDKLVRLLLKYELPRTEFLNTTVCALGLEWA